MRGGGVADLLDGGPGRNTLPGGADADVFRFAQGSTTRIGDLEDGMDRRCIRTEPSATFGDLVITGHGASGRHGRVTREKIVIELLNVDRSLIDARDMDLLF